MQIGNRNFAHQPFIKGMAVFDRDTLETKSNKVLPWEIAIALRNQDPTHLI
jgi:hypothetical protein